MTSGFGHAEIGAVLDVPHGALGRSISRDRWELCAVLGDPQ